MAVITSTATGDFNVGATWVGGVAPTDGDNAVIANGHTVSIDGDITVGNDSATPAIDISGVLERASSANDWTLECKGDVSVNSGGEFNVDMSSNAGNTQTVKMNCATTDGKYGIKADDGSKVVWVGASKLYATQLNDASASASDTTITVDGDITGWQVDDELIIEGDVAGETEKVVIASISSQVVTIDAPGLVYQHDDDRKVVNLTRNVVFKSDNASYQTFIYSDISASTDDFSLTYCELYNLHGGWLTRGVNSWNNAARGEVINCSLHTGVYAIYGIWKELIVTNNIVYNTTSNGIYFSTGSGYTIEGNYGFDLRTFFQTDTATNIIFNDNYGADNHWCIRLNGAAVFNQFDNNSFRTNSEGDVYIVTDKMGMIVATNCMFLSTVIVTNMSNSASGSYFRIDRHNSNDDDYRSYEKYGVVRSTGAGLADTETRTVGSLALKMTPNDTDNALEWKFTVPCVADKPMAVTGYLKSTEDCSGDTEPTIEVSGCGGTADTYTFDTATNEDNYEQFILSFTPTANGLATVIVKTYKNAGNAPDFYLDDIVVASTAINLGALDYWYNGLPAPILLSTGLGANDVWSALTADNTIAGSFGEKIGSKLLTLAKFLGLK